MDYLTYKIGFLSGLILFALLGLVTTYRCSKECNCYPTGDNVSAICHFSNLNFKSFNFSILALENTTALRINCNELGLSPITLQPRMFQELYRLGEMVISSCYLDQIDEDVFAGLGKLKNLSILNSRRLSIHPKTFLHVPNLEILEIVNSSLHGLSPNCLCILSKIQTLDFSGNQISNMDETLCSRKESFFNKLTFLKLDYNQIQILKSDFRQKLPNLQRLSLKGNRIDKIENGALTNFSQLIYLDVSNNNLTQLPDDFLSGCFQVQTLDVSNSFMTKLPPAIREMRNLSTLEADNTLLIEISLLKQASLRKLKIHNSRLKTIPPKLCGKDSELEQLDLGQNSISKVPPNIFNNCTKLQWLDLSTNNILNLFNESFKGLKSLSTLNLSNNNISSCGEKTFLNIQNLIQLNLSSNSLPEIPLIPERLETMDLNNNQIRSISNMVFSHYPSFYLERLFLADNHIQTIESRALWPLYKLTMLNLKNNNLRILNKSNFKNVKLYILDIAHNKITDIHKVLDELMTLRYLYAQHNLISKLKPQTFPDSITAINLSNNQIKTVEDWTFSNLRYSNKVDLRMNRIGTLSQSSVKLHLSNVISNFYILGNPFQCDCELAWLKKNSELKSSRIWTSYPAFPDLGKVTCLKNGKPWLPGGMFQKIEANKFVCAYERSSRLKLPFSCGIYCGCCFQENCYCQDTCPENCLCTHTYDYNVNRVNCTHGNLTHGTGIPSNATWIDLSANDLGYLSEKSFITQTKAETLYLNHSKITGIGERTFNTFISLKVLHLEYNEIRMLDSNSFGGLRNLKRLILNHNKIERIFPGTFNVTPSLEHLDLSYNRLRQIDSQQIFNENSLKTIILSGNPWSCDCKDMKSLLELLVSKSSEIDPQTLLCDQSQIPILQYDIDSCRNKSLNSTIQILPVQDTILVYGLSIGLTFIVAVLIAGTILYMYRKEIQILFYVRFGWRILSKKNRLDEEDKKYDAFVSYHNSQDDFVVYEMLPRLEGTNPAYKLCVHFRDFLAGAAIVDNITEAIGNSKRTILLLNDQFLTSEWCRYEFQAAHYDALSTKLNTLILVLLEDVNLDLVDDGLKLYMKTKTYLRYDDPRFWEKLRFALPEKKEETTVNELNLTQLAPI